MNERLTLPKKIKVGFQERSGTYDGLLAYIIYFDAKGVLRKEKSWESWRSKSIEPKEFDNVPTSGFVLNKKVGGYASGWNHRNTYCRVWDPRGFEFEITLENLLFILQECTSTKGKGLEGQFVYAWDKKDLVLLPVDSEDYKAVVSLENKKEKITSKNIIVGGSYKSKLSNELVYLGREPYHEFILTKEEYTNSNSTRYRSSYIDERTFELKSSPMFLFYDRLKNLIHYTKDTKHLDFLIDDKAMLPCEVSEYIELYYNTFEGRGNHIDKLEVITSKKDIDDNDYDWVTLGSPIIIRDNLIYYMHFTHFDSYIPRALKIDSYEWGKMSVQEQKKIYADYVKSQICIDNLKLNKVMEYNMTNKTIVETWYKHTIELTDSEIEFIKQNLLCDFSLAGVCDDNVKLKTFNEPRYYKKNISKGSISLNNLK